MPHPRFTRPLTFSFAGFAVLLLLALSFALKLEQILTHTARELHQAHELPFRLEPLRLPQNPGFSPLLSPANLTAAAAAGQSVYLAGPTEVVQFGGGGIAERILRVGVDLPAAALGPMISARIHGTSGPRIVIGTDGAGVLLVDPSATQILQLLPADPNLRDITAIAALPEGDLVFGTREHGVLRFDGEALSVYRPEYRSTAVTALLANDDALWVGTQADGLFVTRAGVTHHFSRQMPDPHIDALAARGRFVFAGTPDGVEEFDGQQPVMALARGTFAHALYAAPDRLYIGGLEGGFIDLSLSGTQPATISAPSGSDDVHIQQFLGLTDGLYSVRSDGLYRRVGSRWTPELTLPSAVLADGNIAALAFGEDESLWVGYFDRGLDIIRPGGESARHFEDDHLFCINRIAADPHNRSVIAVATANGLVLFDKTMSPHQVLSRGDGLISEHVTDVAYAGGAMTLATPAGLTFISSKGVESLYAFQGLVNNHVYSVAASPDGKELMAGTLGGMSILEDGSVRRNLTVANSGLRHNWITAVMPLPAFAGDGYLLGTYGGGLMRLTSSEQVLPMDAAPKDVIVNSNALLATSTHLYAGTLGRGLWVFGRGSKRWQQITGGLPSLNVTALATHNGEIYVGTDNGLVHIAEAKLPE